MKPLSGKRSQVRAARVRASVGELDRTLLVVESHELLQGQQRGIAAALVKAKAELRKRQALRQKGRISRSRLEGRVKKALAREHLSSLVVTTIAGADPAMGSRCSQAPQAGEDTARPASAVHGSSQLEHGAHRLRLPRSVEKVEKLFGRARKGGVVPWGPSHPWADGSIRRHTFATVLGLMLVSLARIALAPDASARGMMKGLEDIKVTLVRTATGAQEDGPP